LLDKVSPNFHFYNGRAEPENKLIEFQDVIAILASYKPPFDWRHPCSRLAVYREGPLPNSAVAA
jgi:hypothetical protein